MADEVCIGLFGTCGNSTWRQEFISYYKTLMVDYFNPQVDDWKPEYADIEADHLRNDEIILFPITGESLAETGFSIIQAINSSANRWIVVMIDSDLDEQLKADEIADFDTLLARRVVQAHLSANPHPNVFVVKNLKEMLGLSIKLSKFRDNTKWLGDVSSKFSY